MFDILLLETISTCTRQCSFCAHGLYKKPTLARLEDDLIEKVIHELILLGYRGRFSPFHINEPLLDYERVRNTIQLLKEYCPQAYASIVTNGDLINQHKIDELREVGTDVIGISIYTSTNLMYMNELSLRNKDIIKLIDMRTPKLENRAGSINLGESIPISKPCLRPSSMLVIKASGKAVLCCADMYGDIIVGDIREQSLLEIWEGELLTNYRNTLHKGREGLSPCNKCSYNGRPPIVRWPFPNK